MAATGEGMDQRLREVEIEHTETRTRLDAHEKECSIRYAGIEAGLKGCRSDIRGINGDLKKVGYGLLAGMAGILVKLVFFS